jgi:hypothetical protein
MEGKMLWDKFAKNGKVSDYLAYRKNINGTGAEVSVIDDCMELTEIDKNQRFGVSNKGTERG